MRIPSIVLVLGTWGGWFALERWAKSVSEILDPIHPHLADGILVGLFVSAALAWIYDHRKNSPMKAAHSKKLAKEIEILSKGEFKHTNKGVIVFHVPYPYTGYLEELRKTNFPTNLEIMELMDTKDWSTLKKEYELVPPAESPEGNFTQALAHLDSYKHIKTLLQKTKSATEELDKFAKENQNGLDEIKKKMFKLDEPELHPLYPELDRLSRSVTDPLKELQKALEILSQQLEHGETIKGKCELGY